MIQLDIKSLQSVSELRNALVPLAQEKEFDFGWLEPITGLSLEQQVVLYLTNRPPSIQKFVTLDLREHLSEATNLINNTINVRNEIYGLETQALTAAIEYVQVINSFESSEKLGELDLKAKLKTSLEPGTDYEDALQSRFRNVRITLASRFSLHNQKGNPLNYGERVKKLRRLYCDNVQRVYERLIAIKRTLKYSFSQDTEPLPNYLELADNFDKLIWWMRDAVSDYEAKEQYDYIVRKTISLDDMKAADGKSAVESLIANSSVKFTLADFGINENFERMRLLALSVSIVSNYAWLAGPRPEDAVTQSNWNLRRELMLYRCEITPPEQNPKLDLNLLFSKVANADDEVRDFIKNLPRKDIKRAVLEGDTIDILTGPGGAPKVVFTPAAAPVGKIDFPDKFIVGDLPPVHKSSVNANPDFYTDNSIRNISPLGTWAVSLKNTSLYEDFRQLELTDVKTVALTFELAVRKF